MIKVRYTDDEITAVGHSGYAVNGKDIVCAAVSACFKMAVGMLQANGSKFHFESNESPFIGIRVKPENRATRNVIEVLTEVLKSIEHEYPDYIQVKKVYIPNKKVQ